MLPVLHNWKHKKLTKTASRDKPRSPIMNRKSNGYRGSRFLNIPYSPPVNRAVDTRKDMARKHRLVAPFMTVLRARRYTIFPQSIDPRFGAEIVVVRHNLGRPQVKNRKGEPIKKSPKRRRYLGRLRNRRLFAHVLGNKSQEALEHTISLLDRRRLDL